MKFKNIFVILLCILVFSSLGFSIVAHAEDDDDGNSSVNISREDDDDDDEDESEDREDDEEDEKVVSDVTLKEADPQESETEKKTIMVTKTIVGPPTTIVVNELREVNLPDSDRDGLTDDKDPHPTIPEIYFVKDDNSNGIVDDFEGLQ